MAVAITRRAALAGALLAPPAWTRASATDEGGAPARLAALEARRGGRLGVAALDSGTGARIGRREDERFALSSTFKFLTAAFVLARVDRGEERLERRVVFAERDLVTYSPATKDHVGPGGMTVERLCEAAITLSDNTAGNLLLASFGGPAGLTAFARSLGDEVTRLDRIETDLNEAAPGDPRDTTTPAAMLENLRKILVGEVLSPASRERIAAWLVANRTGDARLRAGVPKEWRVGDKTGTGGHGTTNDVAVLWPPNRAPILVAAYFAESEASPEERNATLAEVGRIVVAAL
jgi:beta-lactamase class A